MKERPILFSVPMVRAILEGRKTQTRRVAKQFYKDYFEPDAIHQIAPGEFIAWEGKEIPDEEFTKSVYHTGSGTVCPYGQPGDRLWVRECFGWNPDYPEGIRPCYRADPGHEYDGIKWKPSIHMPRDASRILLEITDVRVERLNDISESDAIAEGVESWIEDRWKSEPTHYKIYHHEPGDESTYSSTAKYSFSTLWQSINGPDSWDQNPFVWAITFQRIDQ